MGKDIFIKVCGMRDAGALLAAFEAGASAAGFVAYPKSRRHIGPAKLRELLREAPCPGLLKVGVFVDPSLDEIRSYLEAGIDVVQLHGSESPAFALEAARLATVWKAFAPRGEDDLTSLSEFPAEAFLLDAFSPDMKGGSGSLADWSLAKKAAGILSKPLILAGGLSPANVAEAIRTVRPFGVDASSGLESSPGVKSPALVKDFVRAAKDA